MPPTGLRPDAPDSSDVHDGSRDCFSGQAPAWLEPWLFRQGGYALQSDFRDLEEDALSRRWSCRERRLRLRLSIGSLIATRINGRSVGRQAHTMPMQDSMLDHNIAGADRPARTDGQTVSVRAPVFIHWSSPFIESDAADVQVGSVSKVTLLR